MRIGNIRKLERLAAQTLALLLAMLFVLPVLPMPEALAASDGMVRVQLTRLGAHSSLTIQPTCDYYVQGKASVRIESGEKATVSASGSGIWLTVDDVKMSMGSSLKLMRSTAGKTGIRFTSPSMSNLYCGDLFLTASSSILTPVLNIYIEDYLYGVVGYEMSPSWPIEALKAQAVTARNYALRKMSERSGKSYHLVDTTANQVFKGYNSSSGYASVVRAVDATKGVALYYSGSLAQCYYAASNGGQTESTRNAWGSSLKYSSVKDDPYDLQSSGTAKTARIRMDARNLDLNLERALREGVAEYLTDNGAEVDAEGVSIDAIEDVQPADARFNAPSRLYQTMKFTVRATAINVSGQKRSGTATVAVPTYGALESWYALSINSGNNETVWVEKADSAFEITFRRNGHGVGMSQRGAQVMARDYGMNAADILKFYYPGTEAKQLSLTDTTHDEKVKYTPIAAAKAGKGAMMYESASASAASAALPEGAALEIYAVSGSWAAAGYSGVLGFVPVEKLTGYLPVNEKATELAEPCYGVVTAQSAALRQLPAEGSAQLGTLKKDEVVQAHAYTVNWVSVTTAGGMKGYVPHSALKLTEALPTATPVPENGIVIPKERMYAKVSVEAGTVLRQKASASGRVLRNLDAGEYLWIGAYNANWAFVMTKAGEKGYVLRSDFQQVTADEALAGPAESEEVIVPEKEMYARAKSASAVYKYASESASKVTNLAKDEVVQVLAYSKTWVQVQTKAGYKGFVPIGKLRVISAEEAQKPAADDPGTVTVVKGKKYRYISGASAVMYKSWSEDSGEIIRLPYGTKVQLGAYNDEWGYVRANGKIGFIRLSSLTSKSPAAKSEKDVIVADFYARTTKTTKVYKSASTSSKVLGSLASGKRVSVHAYNNAYAYISVGGNYGFVPLKALKIVI